MATKPKQKHPQDSYTETTHLVLPSHTNALGSIFGGTLMSWVDIAAAIAATRHARYDVVTASVDALHFIAPIFLGNMVKIKAVVNFVNHSSMEVGVRVESEDRKTGAVTHNLSAYLTFVALDENKNKIEVARLLPQSADEQRRYEEAKIRRESRIALKQSLELARKEKTSQA